MQKEIHVGVRTIWRLVPLLGLLIVAVSAASVAAFGHPAAAPKVVGNATAGKAAFASAGCGACHALKAAKSKGTIGPNLDTESLTEAKIITQITNGGYGVMGAAAKKTYPFPMSGFKGKLTTAQIQNIAAFVFTKRTGGTPAVTTTTASSSGATPTTTAAQPGSASAPSSTNNGCPAGVTIQTSGSTDNDSDENGDVNDNDGCI
jgi:mono/diheme cytochrome c family protein